MPEVVAAFYFPAIQAFAVEFSRPVNAATAGVGSALRIRIDGQTWFSGTPTQSSPTVIAWSLGTGPSVDPGPDVVWYTGPNPPFTSLAFDDGELVQAFEEPWVQK